MKVYDTLAAKKKDFVPGSAAAAARIFLCGPTVYDYSHVGHARMLLFYDAVTRYLRFLGAETRVIVNITDIDPKIFARAKAEGMAPKELATYYISELLYDAAALGIDGFAFARVSDHVHTAQALARRLLDEGKAYIASGNVYLDAKSAGFGRLSKMTDKELADCRLDIAPGKKSPLDILLWSTNDDFGISFSDRVLGSGIPWWHMQDTSVAVASFGGAYDMHGGADELVYPHHESHLAQMSAITSEKEPVKLWTHVGLVYVKGKKMSKSLGNAVAIKRLLQDHSANAVRLYLYSTHYRERLDFAENRLAKYAELDDIISSAADKKCKPAHMKKFMQKMDDDFDTQGAMRVMLEAARAGAGTREMAEILGLRY
ncbi:cysteinyl-tRNA synthetase [Candidatus Nitrososphaera evergladensis SR1]|uniref:Cysteinyl-tRNA synthetase n=1 Tax=Candidatus Nitrososphaera evergladensis SR1 TaxID=1459636 RepID=A0A075MR89_9ARCH|nr:class I tRNA ligase family protein [Candidatus Nitrososphaera evergladensis]AIF83708.1 cysteinyl-tRNA synthetase [Candidatus Nitrososphaera evergladensis SR1]